MSKLGTHVTQGGRTGYGPYCAAKPAVVLAANEGGALLEAKANSGGHAFTVFRDTTVYLDAPHGIDQATPEQARQMADNHWPVLRAKWQQNPADAYTVLNEPAGHDLAVMPSYLAYELRMMELAEADGLKLCVLNLATGTPDFDVWQAVYAPHIRRAFEAGHVYGRHLYDGNGLARALQEAGWLHEQGIIGGVVITEAGLNGGYGYVGDGAWLAWAAQLDEQLQAQPLIIGACLWTLGDWNGANWQSALPEMTAYLAANPSPKWELPEEEPVTRGQPRTQYARTYNVIPDDATEEEAVAIFLEGWRRSRETAGGSYDDAGVGDLDTRRANLYGKAGERATFEAWFAEHYPGVQLAFPPVPGRAEPSPQPQRAVLCDVSSHQGAIDFQRMAGRGVAGVYMRGSIGRAGLDTRFASYWQAIRATGMKRGMYHLWRSDATAEQNLANIVRVMDQHGAGDLRIAIDVEPTTDLARINGNEVARFIPLFRAQFGYEPLIYTGLWVMDRVDGDRSWFASSLLWLANYWSQPPQPGQYPTIPAGNTRDRLLMHQWTSSYYDGRTWGVSSAGLDVNVAYDLNRLLVTGSAPPPPPPPSTAIDLLPYIKGDGRAYMVRHPSGAQEKFRTEVDGPWFYLVKNSQWEQFRADDTYIWRGLDTSPGDGRYYWQREAGNDAARWCKRHMYVGETWAGPGHYVQFYDKSNCQPVDVPWNGPATNSTRLVARHASRTWNGITVQDVVELDGGPGSAERFFFARGYGLVAWEATWGSSAISEVNVAGDNARERLCS